MKYALIILVFISASSFGQIKKDTIQDRSLLSIGPIMPQACDYPYNIPFFHNYDLMQAQEFNGYYHWDTTEYIMDGELKMTRYFFGPHDQVNMEVVHVMYDQGMIVDTASSRVYFGFIEYNGEEIKWDEVAWELEDEVLLVYETQEGYVEMTQAIYKDHMFDPVGDGETLVITQNDPWYYSRDYFRHAYYLADGKISLPHISMEND